MTSVCAADPGALASDCLSRQDHPAIRACLTEEAAAADRRMLDAERQLIERVSDSTLGPEDKTRLLDAAKAAMRSFRQFKDDQCEFAWATAAGGNSAGDKRLMCAAYLSDTQAAAWNSYVPLQ